MTARDLAWRIGGGALFGIACAIGQSRSFASSGGIGTLLGLVAFVLAIAGVVLLAQGKRIPMAFRVERSGHRNLVAAIHSRRQRRGRDADRTAR
jgi:type IV secretory pathway TrbF-like protein